MIQVIPDYDVAINLRSMAYTPAYSFEVEFVSPNPEAEADLFSLAENGGIAVYKLRGAAESFSVWPNKCYSCEQVAETLARELERKYGFRVRRVVPERRNSGDRSPCETVNDFMHPWD